MHKSSERISLKLLLSCNYPKYETYFNYCIGMYVYIKVALITDKKDKAYS